MSEAEKREYQEKLGEDFGTILYEVRNDWLTGLVRLKEYRVLFTDREAVKLLNAVGGASCGTFSRSSGAISCCTSRA